MKFGEKIKFLREKHNLFQREVAAELKIDAPLYSKIEGGLRNARREQVEGLAKIFNVNEEELISSWLADRIIDLLKEEKYGLKSLAIAAKNLYATNLPFE